MSEPTTLRERNGMRHRALRPNDEDAEWTPILCGGGIILPGTQTHEPVDCPECLALLKSGRSV
jgi:hypothetical protein